MNAEKRIDEYIQALPEWQQVICNTARQLIHDAVPDIVEEIKFTNRPYFTYKGNVCAFLATKDHVNIFIYDPIAPDPAGIINQGHQNATARSIQLYEGDLLDAAAFIALLRAVAQNNQNGGWRKIKY